MSIQQNLKDKTLLLVDGSSYLYRAYHAMPDLRGPNNQPTGALYGIINMLKRINKTLSAQYIACVFDAKGKTFRDTLYPNYKANRPSMPEDLVAQIKPIHQAVKALGWPLLMFDGVEADDVIGTLAKRAQIYGMKVIISTGDKDMAQLVNEHITLMNTMNNELLDIQGVHNKFGVFPEQMVDYLSLIGDSVDNVPGVAKCGPKTAQKWLSQYKSLQQLMKHMDEIKGVVGENLRQAKDFLPLAQQLITIKTDCELPADIFDIAPGLSAQIENLSDLRNLFQTYGFKTWLKELDQKGNEAFEQQPTQLEHHQSSSEIEKHYEVIQTWEQFEHLLEQLQQASLVAFDTETTSLDVLRAQLVGISFSIKAGKASYIPLAHHALEPIIQLPLDRVLEKLTPWFESEQHIKVGQNAKYDIQVLRQYGINVKGVKHDTMLESYVLASYKSHSMDKLAQTYLNIQTTPYLEVVGKGAQQISFADVPLSQAVDYAAEDADVTFRLHQVLHQQIEQDPELAFVYNQIEMPVMSVLTEMELTGVLIDSHRLLTQSQELAERLLQLEQQAYLLASEEFNLGSPKQLGAILFEKLKLPVIKKTPSGVPSTDEEVLQKLAEDYPLPKVLLEYRGLAKLKSTYTDKLPRMVNPKTGRVHTHYAQAVAVTGRLTSNEPNLQNIPIRTTEGRRIREAFIAPIGSKIVSADYSQIELRIMAHLSEDPALLKAFAEGEDVHRATAAEVFSVLPIEVNADQRRIAKVINFGLIYGMSAFGLAANLGITRDAAKLYIDRYFARYPGVARYMEETKIQARTLGYIKTVFGRRLWLPEINGGNGPRRQAAERAAINGPMQGTAADLIKLSMIAVQHWLQKENMRSRLIMQVHDELVLEVPENELQIVRKKLPQLMAQVAHLKVPLVAEVGQGDNWDQAH